jgi:site-specific DNA-methyltransferase (adenine-specific)
MAGKAAGEARPEPQEERRSEIVASIVEGQLDKLKSRRKTKLAAAAPGVATPTNLLYYGDNLEILRRYLPDESVDLVYLDPPFNSKRDYNVIFKDESGNRSDAQMVAFEDTWHWGPAAEMQYAYLTNTLHNDGRIPDSVSTIVAAFRSAIGTNQMAAYLVEMAARLVELHRVLKRTGSLYLHCDPTASHYLKLLLDAVFGPRNFRNEIVWKRANAHNDPKRFGRVSDTLLYYSKGISPIWNTQHTPYREGYYKSHYKVDADGRYFRTVPLDAPKHGEGSPGLLYEWKGKLPAETRTWAVVRGQMKRYETDGRLRYTRTGTPTLMQYADEMPGVPLQNIWTDIPPVNPQARERIGWDTQKPLALLQRVITASSNPGDIVLDPFCGCGTALVASERLKRRWIGIDVTYLAISVMKSRLRDSCGLDDVKVVNQPTEVEGARQLAQSSDGRYQFQWWALGLVDARPIGGLEKKGRDRGIDGRLTFTDQHGALKGVLVSVKSGHVNSGMVRDLKGTVEREKAAIGLFVTLDEPSREMRLEASTAGFYHSSLWNREYPRLQILTIKGLLAGHKPALPPFVLPTYQQAPRDKGRVGEQESLALG